MVSILRFITMAGRKYSLLLLVVYRVLINVNPEGIDRGLQCVEEYSKRSIW
jgi:hypothetical protein